MSSPDLNWPEILKKLAETEFDFLVVGGGALALHGIPRTTLDLDIYFPDFNIGIEYQGAQHFQPVEIFGGEEGFKKNQERDKRKKKLCKQNNCILIYVLPDYDAEDILKEINKHIQKVESKSIKKT